jgi:hypothetical protein
LARSSLCSWQAAHTTGSSRRPRAYPKLESGGETMKLIKRVAVAIGSLMAVVVAGGAHWKV